MVCTRLTAASDRVYQLLVALDSQSQVIKLTSCLPMVRVAVASDKVYQLLAQGRLFLLDSEPQVIKFTSCLPIVGDSLSRK